MTSRREFARIAGVSTVALAAVACGGGDETSAPTVDDAEFPTLAISVYSEIPTAVPVVGKQLDALAAGVHRLTGNKISIVSAQSASEADCVLLPAHNAVDQLGVVALLLEGVPNGLTVDEHVAWLHSTASQGLLADIGATSGVEIIPATAYGLQCGWSNREIASVSDLRGLKMRAAGLTGRALARLGVEVTELSPADISQALHEGRIDACEFLCPAVDMSMLPRTKDMTLVVGWNERVSQSLLLVSSENVRKHPRVVAMLRSVCRGLHIQQAAEIYAANAEALQHVKNLQVLSADVQHAVIDAVAKELAQLVDEDQNFASLYLQYSRWADMVRPWTMASEQRYIVSRG